MNVLDTLKMAENPQRTVLVKNLEISKLRQRISELENESIQIETKHAEELSILAHENETFNRQNEIEIKTKIRQLEQNNQRLAEDLVETTKSQCRAEEEIAVVSEKNCVVTYDNEKLKTKLGEISMEKERESQKLLENLKKFEQQNIELQEEFATSLKEAKAEIRKKDSQIFQLTHHLDESTKGVDQQEALEKTIRKLQAEKSALQLELQETDANRNSMAEILLKNKELLTRNKKLEAENEKLLTENHNKENIEEIKNTLEAAQREISELKETNLTLETELRGVGLVLKAQEELLDQKRKLEEENQGLKKKSETNEAEIEKNNQSMTTFASDSCALKRRIEHLETSNFRLIQFIAKLKASNEHA